MKKREKQTKPYPINNLYTSAAQKTICLSLQRLMNDVWYPPEYLCCKPRFTEERKIMPIFDFVDFCKI